MKPTKHKLINDVTTKINALPDDKKQYVLGIMDGILISCNEHRSDVKETKDEKATED